MRRQLIGLTAAAVFAGLLSGCWDQQLLKDQRNVSIGGMDLGAGGKLRASVNVRDITMTETGSKDTSEFHAVIAKTTQHARGQIDREMAGNYSAAKLRVLLLGEEMVLNHDVMPYLDVYYRDPKSPLGARVAVAKGKAEEMVKLRKIGEMTIGLYLDNLLKTYEQESAIPNITIETLHPLDRGFDFALPYVANRQGKPTVNGIAMFDGTRMTGKLNPEESKVYMLLLGKKKDNLRLTLKAINRERDDGYNFVTVDVGRIKRKMKVAVSGDGQVSVRLNLKLKVTVIEDPSNRLYRMDVVRKLERFLSEQLTDRSRQVVGKMQKARHDGFGIARTLMARHPKAWKGMEWKEEYPHIAFDTSVSVQIANTGITR